MYCAFNFDSVCFFPGPGISSLRAGTTSTSNPAARHSCKSQSVRSIFFQRFIQLERGIQGVFLCSRVMKSLSGQHFGPAMPTWVSRSVGWHPPDKRHSNANESISSASSQISTSTSSSEAELRLAVFQRCPLFSMNLKLEPHVCRPNFGPAVMPVDRQRCATFFPVVQSG